MYQVFGISRFYRKEGGKKKERAKRGRKKRALHKKKRKKRALSKEKKRRAKEGASKNTRKIPEKHGFQAKIIVKKKKRGRKEGSQKSALKTKKEKRGRTKKKKKRQAQKRAILGALLSMGPKRRTPYTSACSSPFFSSSFNWNLSPKKRIFSKRKMGTLPLQRGSF